jgi:hypothetical protein
MIDLSQEGIRREFEPVRKNPPRRVFAFSAEHAAMQGNEMLCQFHLWQKAYTDRSFWLF